jgi:hypothetical protein
MHSLHKYKFSTADWDLNTNSRVTPLLFYHEDEHSSKIIISFIPNHMASQPRKPKSSLIKVNTWMHGQA